MKNPSTAELDQWLKSSKIIEKIALAPERDRSQGAISSCDSIKMW